MEVRNCRTSCEDSITRASWTRTYRFVVIEHCGVDPDEKPHGGVPVLQYSQARSGRRDLGKSYSNEERE